MYNRGRVPVFSDVLPSAETSDQSAVFSGSVCIKKPNQRENALSLKTHQAIWAKIKRTDIYVISFQPPKPPADSGSTRRLC